MSSLDSLLVGGFTQLLGSSGAPYTWESHIGSTRATLCGDCVELAQKDAVLQLPFADLCGAALRYESGHVWILSIAYAPVLPLGGECMGRGRRCRVVELVSRWHADEPVFLNSSAKRAVQWLAALRDALGLGLQHCLPQSGEQVTSGKLLVLVNPASGSDGQAATVWADAAPLFAAAGAATHVIVTTHAGHAKELLKDPAMRIGERDAEYAALLVVSGDGLVSEVLNGVHARSKPGSDNACPDDVKIALRALPLGVLPGGSGNGLCASVCRASGEQRCGAMEAAFVAARALWLPHERLRRLDLARVQLDGETPEVAANTLAFLSVSWGVIADIDLEADFLRPLCGARRWELWQRWRMAHPRCYRGRLEYLVEGARRQKGDARGDGAAWAVLEGDWVLLWACNTALMTMDFGPCPGARLDDGLWHIAVAPSGGGVEASAAAAVAVEGAGRSVAALMAEHAAVAAQMGRHKLRVIRTAAWRLHPNPPVPLAADGDTGAALRVEAETLLRDAGLALREDAARAGLEGVRTPSEAERAMRRLVHAAAEAAPAAAALAAVPASEEWLSVDGERAHHGVVAVDVLPSLGLLLCEGALVVGRL